MSTRTPAVLIAGDSIAADTYVFSLGDVSYMTRACMNAGIPILKISEGGMSLYQIIDAAKAQKRLRLAKYCTDVIDNYGVNDIYGGGARTLAQLKADTLTACQMYRSLGLRVSKLTVLPKPGASTDGYQTVAGQSIASAPLEAIRTAYNSWLRDTSASGAKAQANGNLFQVLDPCAYIEVNSSGVLTLNGGFIAVPGGAVITGTATGYTTTSVTDSGASRTTNTDRGKTLAIMTATTGAGQSMMVNSNTATAWTLSGSITLPTGTVTYQVGPSYMADGTHLTEPGHDFLGGAMSLGALT